MASGRMAHACNCACMIQPEEINTALFIAITWASGKTHIALHRGLFSTKYFLTPPSHAYRERTPTKKNIRCPPPSHVFSNVSRASRAKKRWDGEALLTFVFLDLKGGTSHNCLEGDEGGIVGPKGLWPKKLCTFCPMIAINRKATIPLDE